MDKVLAYLKTSIKIAAKSVFKDLRQYAFFFVALFIIESALCVVMLVYENNNNLEFGFYESEYDYHIAFLKLSEESKEALEDGSSLPKYRIYNVAAIESAGEDEFGLPIYNVYLRFTIKNTNEAYGRFQKSVLRELYAIEEKDTLFIKYSPLFNVGEKLAQNRTAMGGVFALVGVISTLLLISLYNIRVNHYKFVYGIYMTFGANFKKLVSTSFWELEVIALTVFLPAGALSAVLCRLTYVLRGYDFSVNIFKLLWVIPASVVITMLSVYFPMKVMSLRQPMKLIIAEDNSNLVTSPRRSVNILEKSFPQKYEALSLLRFRKYLASLLITASLMCALFISGIYLYRLTGRAIESFTSEKEQFKVNFTGSFMTDADFEKLLDGIDLIDSYTLFESNGEEGAKYIAYYSGDEAEKKNIISRLSAYSYIDVEDYSDADTDEETEKTQERQESTQEERDNESNRLLISYTNTLVQLDNLKSAFLSVPGVKRVDGDEIRTYGKAIEAHLSVPGSNAAFLSGLMANPANGAEKVTNEFSLIAYDTEIKEQLVRKYEYKGDIEAALEDKYSVVIGTTINNNKAFRFKVGDKIKLCTVAKRHRAIEGLLNNKLVLYQQISYYSFNETILTVAAILEGEDSSDGGVPLYISAELYNELTGDKAVCTAAKVFMDSALSPSGIKRAEAELNTWAKSYVGTTITNTNAQNELMLNEKKGMGIFYAELSILVLLICPVVWFFSQGLYYKKRENEFTVLRAIAAVSTEIRKIYIYGSLILSVMSAVFAVLVSLVSLYIINKIYNYILPVWLLADIPKIAAYEIPVTALLAVFAVSLALGFLSSYLPCLSYFKRMNKEEDITASFEAE